MNETIVNKGFRDELKIYNSRQRLTIKCPICGHSIVFLKDVERTLCTWCHHYCYKDKETENKYKFREQLRKELKK